MCETLSRFGPAIPKLWPKSEPVKLRRELEKQEGEQK